MPFPFDLPTTSASALTTFYASQTHPSLIFTATSQRALVRDSLKKHKRLDTSSRATNISALQEVLSNYIPYLLSIYTSTPDGFGATNFGGVSRPSITEVKDLVVEWRSTLAAGIPGREPGRIKVKGVRNELAFVLQTLAYTNSHLARTSLFQLSQITSPSAEVRASYISTAMKHLLQAHSIHTYTSHLAQTADQPAPLDVSPPIASALASLTLAEATLVVVAKDDPYAAAVIEDRNKDSKEWMIAAPSLPKVRAHLFARICVAAADHASKAASLLPKSTGLGSNKINEDLASFALNLRRTARAKAIRFLGVDAEASAKTGEAIAWLRAAKRELGVAMETESAKRSGLKGLKQSWTERREDRRLEKGADDWGMDAGRLEEIRVVEWLEAKWVKANDMINVQPVPPFEPLLATMPSGREYHSPQPYNPPTLSASNLNSMKAPLDPGDQVFLGDEEDSGDEGRAGPQQPVGAFPGTAGNYGRSDSSYY